MRIGLDDIDPAVAHAVAERLAAPIGEFLKDNVYWGGLAAFRLQWKANEGKMKMTRKRDASEIEKRAFELRKKREERMGIRAAVAALVPVMVGSAIFLPGLASGSSTGILAGLGTWVGGTVIGAAWTARATPKHTLKKVFLYDEMRAVFPLLTLTRAERIYCDALQLMARTDVDDATELSLRAMLKQLNQLLENHRQIESRKQALLSVMGMNNISELEAEYGALGRRLDQSKDPVARQALQQSLQACAARLENAKTLTQNLERLNVQQEAISQTLSSALSAMARMQVAPQVQMSLVAEEITTSVTQMNQQTYAVEQAVEEVVRLGH